MKKDLSICAAIVIIAIFLPLSFCFADQFFLEGPSEVMEGYVKDGVVVRGQAQYSLLFCPTGQYCQKVPQSATWSIRAPATTLEGIKPAPVISATGLLRVGRVAGAKNISIRCRFIANDGTPMILVKSVRIIEVTLAWYSYPHGNPSFADWTMPDTIPFYFSLLATYAGGVKKIVSWPIVDWSVKHDPYSTAPVPYFIESTFYPGDIRVVPSNKVTVTGTVTVRRTKYSLSHQITVLNKYGGS